jgi:hypothetical protein
MTALRNIEFNENLISEVTGARSGRAKTDVKVITFDLLQHKLMHALQSHSISSRRAVITALAGFYVELFNKLGIITESGSIETFDYKTNFYLTKSYTINEMKRARLQYTLGLFDMDKVAAKKEVGISILASEIASQAYNMESSLMTIDNIGMELDTVLSLIKMYSKGHFEHVTEEEKAIFEDARFLNLAHNLSFIKMSVASNLNRPRSSNNYWVSALERVDSAIKSSPVYKTVELAALKEYYTSSIINDTDGLKKGLVVSRNVRESAPLQVFKKMTDALSNEDQMWRLSHDPYIERNLENGYNSALHLTMDDVHRYAVALHHNLARAEDDLFTSIFGVEYEDLTYLAAAYGAKVEINSDPEVAAIRKQLIFRVDTTNSKIRTPLHNFIGTMKTEDPLLAILINGSDYQGKTVVSHGDRLVEEVKGKSFTNIREFMDNRFEKESKISLSSGKTNVKLDIKLSELLATKNLDNTYNVIPIQGSIIYENFLQFFSEIVDYNKSVQGDNKKDNTDFEMNASIAFVSMIEPLFKSQDVQDIKASAIGLIWEHLVSEGKSVDEGHSIIADYRLETQLSVQMGLLLLNKLGFIKTNERVMQTMKIFDNAHVFSQMNVLK